MCVCSILLLTGDETGATSLEEMIKGGELGMANKFASLSEVVSEKTLNAVTDMGFTDMMEIQHKSIRPLLDGKCMYMYCVMYVTGFMETVPNRTLGVTRLSILKISKHYNQPGIVST